MRLHTLLPIAVTLALSGCLSTGPERLGADHYRLQQAYQSREDLQNALAAHESSAARLCPDGYYKRKDFDRVDGAERILVWEIACNSQYRPDHSKSRLPAG